MKRWLKRRRKQIAVGAASATALLIAAWCGVWFGSPFPIERLENWPASPEVTDRYGRELLHVVGIDGQLRRPVRLTEISPWLVRATIAIEDERFESHPGVDPIAIARAAGQNLRERRVASGASTITMQVCRMMDNRPRTVRSKLVESFRALQLESAKDKPEILEAYLNLAPYGGNVRGAETAARFYFGKRAADLSLSEAALLAGLPQSPSRYRPDRYPESARKRRSAVLRRMHELNLIDERQRATADAEAIHLRTAARGIRAPHAAWLALARRPLGGQTTIDLDVQVQVERLASAHAAQLPIGSDLAVVVIEIDTGDIVAMVGSADPLDAIDGQVNGCTARRSPGSALKPFVYAAAFEAGRLNRESLLLDAPIARAAWTPANFGGEFAGRLTAAEALRRSLNIPAILVAESTGLARCLGTIESAGVALPRGARDRGGLGVVVGAMEVSLLDLTNGYATLGRCGVRKNARLFLDDESRSERVLRAETCAAIDDILSSTARRPNGAPASTRDRVPWFMWKTGTSAGRRDAWAVGHNRRFAAGVWVGRFAGPGHPAFVGSQAAEPLIAAIFSSPLIRSEEKPATPEPLRVVRPLRAPADLQGPLKILTPAHGLTYRAAARSGLMLKAKASRDEPLAWFLNGRLLEPAAEPRLELSPGAYELRCATLDGESTSVRFLVK